MVWIVVGNNLATKSNDIPIRDPKSLRDCQIVAIIDQSHNPGIPGEGGDLPFELLTVERETVYIEI